MKSTWLLLAGIAIGALGSGTYIATSQKDANVSNSTIRIESESDNITERREFRPLWNPNKGTKSKTVSHKKAIASDTGSADTSSKPALEPSKTITRPLVRNTPRDLTGSNQTSEAEFAKLAAQIEQRANRELDRLSRLLDLSEEQQNRIFPLLARSSTAFHPALAVQVGEAETSNVTNLPDNTDTSDRPSTTAAAESSEPLLAKEADEDIHEILNEEQQQKLEDELVDEDLWWTDIVDDLEDELDESTAVASEEDTGYEGNTGIGNLLQQAAESASEDE